MLLRDVNISAAVLLLWVQALHGSALPAVSSYEFTAYRMQQYNLAQQKHGRIGRLGASASTLPTKYRRMKLLLRNSERVQTYVRRGDMKREKNKGDEHIP